MANVNTRKGRKVRRVYISGPMTGYAKLNKPAFDKAARSLRKAGFHVISPPEEDLKIFDSIELAAAAPTESTYQSCIRRDIHQLTTCDSIHLLNGWERSRGATLEMLIAKEMGVTFVDSSGKTVEPPRAHTESILIEAERLTNGPRRKTYGHPLVNFQRTADMWSAILGTEVSHRQVGLCMVAAKLARESYAPKRDNLVDIAGYANTVDMIDQALLGDNHVVNAIKERADA